MPAELPAGDVVAPVTLGAPSAEGAVVALVAGDAVVCSGVVVAPRVVLTAAHCVADGGGLLVFAGADVAQGGAWVSVDDHVVHPRAQEGVAATDVAVLLTGEELPVAPIPFADGLLEGEHVAGGVRVAGFGVPASDGVGGVRLEGRATVDTLAPDHLRLAGDPSLPCFGDSGGPVLASLDGVTTVIGVIAGGDSSCAAFALASRTVDVASLVDEVVPAEGPAMTPAAAGCAVGGPAAPAPAVLVIAALVIGFTRRGGRP